MTNTELEIMLDAATYLGAHSQPPPNGTDTAVDWWMDAAADVGAIAAKWDNFCLAAFDISLNSGHCQTQKTTKSLFFQRSRHHTFQRFNILI